MENSEEAKQEFKEPNFSFKPLSTSRGKLRDV